VAERPAQPHPALLPAQRAQLAPVCLHVAIKLPSIVGNLNVDRREARVIPFRFAAKVHKHLSGKSDRPQFSMGPTPAICDRLGWVNADLPAAVRIPAGPALRYPGRAARRPVSGPRGNQRWLSSH
jgi:hypothetical protein